MKSQRAFDAHVVVSSFGRHVEVWLHRKGLMGANEITEVVAPMTMTINPICFDAPGCEINEPSLMMDRDTAMNLMDALWAAGFRPNNGESSDAQVSAIKNHLEDMRKLVFK